MIFSISFCGVAVTINRILFFELTFKKSRAPGTQFDSITFFSTKLENFVKYFVNNFSSDSTLDHER